MRRFGSFTCKTVLNLLEAVYLRLRKIVVERVTVVKFRVDNEAVMVLAVLESRQRRIQRLTNTRIAGLRK